jgi:hypothetical protein
MEPKKIDRGERKCVQAGVSLVVDVEVALILEQPGLAVIGSLL